jgi:hypothetical protein
MIANNIDENKKAKSMIANQRPDLRKIDSRNGSFALLVSLLAESSVGHFPRLQQS